MSSRRSYKNYARCRNSDTMNHYHVEMSHFARAALQPPNINLVHTFSRSTRTCTITNIHGQ